MEQKLELPPNQYGNSLSAPYAERDNSAPAIRHRLRILARLRNLRRLERSRVVEVDNSNKIVSFLSMANIALRISAIRGPVEGRTPRPRQVPTRWGHLARNVLRRPILPF